VACLPGEADAGAALVDPARLGEPLPAGVVAGGALGRVARRRVDRDGEAGLGGVDLERAGAQAGRGVDDEADARLAQTGRVGLRRPRRVRGR
jgi:hypothetical protein